MRIKAYTRLYLQIERHCYLRFQMELCSQFAIALQGMAQDKYCIADHAFILAHLLAAMKMPYDLTIGWRELLMGHQIYKRRFSYHLCQLHETSLAECPAPGHP